MDNNLFEQLLYEEESTTLDFKKEQYHFVKASDEDKSELLKDILGFSNAWRRSNAYILIGVEEVRGGRSKVIGIPSNDHLDDHSLQQFVNSLTNQPVRFHYEAFGFEGKQVGIIRIDEQIRPIYLKRDYGKLKKECVYVRRGSSTNPTKPASLEEIAQMRLGMRKSFAELIVEFANSDRDNALGSNLSLDMEFCHMPESEDIPDLDPPRREHPLLGSITDFNLINQINEDFYREFAEYLFVNRLFRSFRLVLNNIGDIAANNVRVELTIPVNAGAIVLEEYEIPDVPHRYKMLFNQSVIDNINPATHSPGDVLINKNRERFQIEIDCGALQPGRLVWSEPLYIGVDRSGEVSFHGLIFADNLPKPKNFELKIVTTVTQTTVSIEELCLISDSIG